MRWPNATLTGGPLSSAGSRTRGSVRPVLTGPAASTFGSRTGLRVAWLFSPLALGRKDGGLLAAAAAWMRPKNYTIGRVIDAHAKYALRISGAS